MSSAAPEVESPITAGRLRAPPYLSTATARHSRPRVCTFAARRGISPRILVFHGARASVETSGTTD